MYVWPECMFVCMCVCKYTLMNVRVYVYVCVCIYNMCINVHVCMYVCMYVCIGTEYHAGVGHSISSASPGRGGTIAVECRVEIHLDRQIGTNLRDSRHTYTHHCNSGL